MNSESTGLKSESSKKLPLADTIEMSMVSETPELRVVRLTLRPGEYIPWHWHSKVGDHIICVQGELEVETRAPKSVRRLSPGDESLVDAKVAHIVRNAIDGTSQFLVIQGIGEYDYNPVGGGAA